MFAYRISMTWILLLIALGFCFVCLGWVLLCFIFRVGSPYVALACLNSWSQVIILPPPLECRTRQVTQHSALNAEHSLLLVQIILSFFLHADY